MPSARPSRRLAAVLVALASADALALVACGGSRGSGSAGTVAAGFDPALDPELGALARKAGAHPTPAPPPEDVDLVALGQALFFDRILSGNRDISCYTCHNVDAGLGDALSVSIGTGGFGDAGGRTLARGRLIPRNAPPLFRLAGRRSLFLDGRVSMLPDGTLATPEPTLNGPFPAARRIAEQLTTALAAQAMFPVTSREEMRGQSGENEVADAPDNVSAWAALTRRLVGTSEGPEAGIPAYRALFARAYPHLKRWDDFNFGHAARAIAAFEATAFSTSGSAFDAWLQGRASALSAEQKRGGILFYGRADCARCHSGPALSDDAFHAVGVPQVGPGKDFLFEDTGRSLVTGLADDRYRFRTPSLRNVELTGPWMHDGAYTTLAAAVRHFKDPAGSLAAYAASQLAPLLQETADTDPARQAARAAAIDSAVRGGVSLTDEEVDQLVAFLLALTDPAALDLSAAEPAEVPSGLPIDDADD